MTLAANVVGNEGVVQRRSRRKVPWARVARRAATVALSLAIGIALWGLLSLRYPTQLLPSPAETFDAFTDLWSDGTIVESVMKSSQRILSGWALGLSVGVPLGLVTVSSTHLSLPTKRILYLSSAPAYFPLQF